MRVFLQNQGHGHASDFGPGGGSQDLTPSSTPSDIPPLPKRLDDRQEGVVYSHMYQGIERLVRCSGRYVCCTCHAAGICGGGQRLERCKGTNNSTSTAALTSPALAPRQRTEHNYAAISTGKPVSRPSDPARAMTAGEEQFFDSVTSIPSSTKSSGCVVMENGIWSAKLLKLNS